METGKIERWFPDRESGYITPDDKSEDVQFFADNLQDADISQIAEGLRVRYELREKSRKPRTHKFWLLDVAQKEAEVSSDTTYRFLNPYNFARFLDKPRPDNNVLGNCPPPPHDRYIGLTGRITCEVEAVTPLFVSDSHAVQEGSDKHKSYRFFQYDGQPAIPASSLRGMIRSVFEAVTNSCLGVFDKAHFKTLEYRKEMEYAQKLKAGIVLTIPIGNKSGEIALCETAKVGAYYSEKKWTNRNIDISRWQCGEYVWARITGHKHKARVWQLAKKEEDIQYTTPRSQTVSGYLKITGNSIETKNNEFLFLDPDKYGNKKIVTFDIKVMDEYNQVLDGQIGEERIEKGWFQNRQLKKGDLVWVEANEQTNEVIRILRVRVPRVPYQKSINDLLSPKFKHLHPCKEPQTLCPACRTFGWVWKRQDKEEKQPDLTAYAGRVRFSHGTLTHKAGTLPDSTTLAILSTPKPTTTLFYLLDKNGKPGDVTYDTPNAQLRGRKVYRHHGNQLREKEYTRAPNGEQNRTVRGALDKGSTFTFTIDFENLAEVELGALLWALELEKDMFHRLGYAKPLGFGSVKIKVTKVERLYPEQRYASLESWDAGWQEIGPDQLDPWKQGFKETLTALYGDFNKLTSITDLRALLSEPPNLHIHYPRPSTAPSDKEENFKWFVVNNKSKHVALPLPEDEKNNPTKNLQVWDEKGNIKS